MLVGVTPLSPSFPHFGTQAFYIISRPNCGKICNTLYIFWSFTSLAHFDIIFNTFQDTGEEGNHRIWEKDFADLLLTYADYSPKKRSAVLKRVKKRHSIYIRTVGFQLIFNFGTFNSFLAGLGRNQVYGAVHVALTKWSKTSLNQFGKADYRG